MLAQKTISAHDIIDAIFGAKHLNEALFMAAASVMDRDQMSALQALAQEVDLKLVAAVELVEHLQEGRQ